MRVKDVLDYIGQSNRCVSRLLSPRTVRGGSVICMGQSYDLLNRKLINLPQATVFR